MLHQLCLPEPPPLPWGGFLCEPMGLGKTVTTLALGENGFLSYFFIFCGESARMCKDDDASPHPLTFEDHINISINVYEVLMDGIFLYVSLSLQAPDFHSTVGLNTSFNNSNHNNNNQKPSAPPPPVLANPSDPEDDLFWAPDQAPNPVTQEPLVPTGKGSESQREALRRSFMAA